MGGAHGWLLIFPARTLTKSTPHLYSLKKSDTQRKGDTMARTISGKMLALDIQRGASYEELLERYDVSPQAMDRFFDGLVKAGKIEASALPHANPGGATSHHLPDTCPKCRAKLTLTSDECPVCGVFVSKYLEHRRKIEEKERVRAAVDAEIEKKRIEQEAKRSQAMVLEYKNDNFPWLSVGFIYIGFLGMNLSFVYGLFFLGIFLLIISEIVSAGTLYYDRESLRKHGFLTETLDRWWFWGFPTYLYRRSKLTKGSLWPAVASYLVLGLSALEISAIILFALKIIHLN